MKGTTTSTKNGAKAHAKPPSSPCSCGCSGGGGSACTCGQPVCFERPNFFGGQLLSDADLSAGQAYFREKQKLYHRTLHGHGVVCGLRLMCDPDCCGHIRVGNGFAIDNCGNDIVICHTASFDVIAALEAKKLLMVDPPPDPCGEEEPPRCKVKQCFYVTICYAEEPAEFTTPFQASCGPATTPCEPTRIKESFRFEIEEHPPKCRSPLDEIEERITCCWKIFTEGMLAKTLQSTFHKDWDERAENDYCQIFCQLQVLFKRHLQACPDLYDCTLFEQVCQLKCPSKDTRKWDDCKESFCALFQLIVRYIFDCILGELIFACPNPPKTSCVGLGTVEVEDGKILRVCNCPRTYVWSFANFFEVLLATVVGGAACAPPCEKKIKIDAQRDSESDSRPPRHHEHDKGGCCAAFLINCDSFLRLFQMQPRFGQFAAAAPVHTIRNVMEALKRGFNFTHPLAFSPRVFEGLALPEAARLFQSLTANAGGELLQTTDLNTQESPDPLAAFLGQRLMYPGDGLAVRTGADNSAVAAAFPQATIVGLSTKNDLEQRLKAAEDKATAAQGLADSLAKEAQAREQEFQALKDAIAKIQEKIK